MCRIPPLHLPITFLFIVLAKVKTKDGQQMFIVNCLPLGHPAGVGKRETGIPPPPDERTGRIDIRLNFNRAINITMLWYIVFRNGLSGG